jgi:hypothetical protein
MPKTTKPRTRKQTPRITAAELDARVNKVFELIVNGFTRYQIMQYASLEKTGWNVTPRQVDTYIAKATALIANEAEYVRPKEFGKAISRLNDLYQKCLKVQDYQRAIAAQRELNALLSLYEPPAERTLRILGVEEKQLAQLITALSNRGIKASDVFNAMLAELAVPENEGVINRQ